MCHIKKRRHTVRAKQSTLRTEREEMVKWQIESRGIHNARLIEAMRTIPRERFVPAAFTEYAYADSALPIDEHQTISQPYVVALMTDALDPESEDRILEIGTGSGYAAAVLAEMVREVYTIERYQSLADTARTRLEALGYHNVHVRCGDGTQGWTERAPFDGIVVAAGGSSVPQSLCQQLAIGGYLVIPVGDTTRMQTLLRIQRIDDVKYEEEDLGAVRFVPLIGAED
jgi:protein-L-isoaspartate(D-aspartate) O-methyltransferase